MDRLAKFLSLVPSARWRSRTVPAAWSNEVRAALSDDLIKIGFGGAIELTEAGRKATAETNK
jgi:hypothetical protein